MTKKIEGKLPVMEQFYTLQGEGTYAGQAAYFVRLSGCDVGCHWCDVKESWGIEDQQFISIQSIIENIIDSEAKIVVVTGGEPFTHDLLPLTEAIKKINIRLHVETAGVYPITGTWDWICLSPKKFKPVLEEYYQQAHELKVIAYNQSDFDWAKEQASKVNQSARLFIQAEWSREPEVSISLVNFVKKNQNWTLSLQTHKYLDIP